MVRNAVYARDKKIKKTKKQESKKARKNKKTKESSQVGTKQKLPEKPATADNQPPKADLQHGERITFSPPLVETTKHKNAVVNPPAFRERRGEGVRVQEKKSGLTKDRKIKNLPNKQNVLPPPLPSELPTATSGLTARRIDSPPASLNRGEPLIKTVVDKPPPPLAKGGADKPLAEKKEVRKKPAIPQRTANRHRRTVSTVEMSTPARLDSSKLMVRSNFTPLIPPPFTKSGDNLYANPPNPPYQGGIAIEMIKDNVDVEPAYQVSVLNRRNKRPVLSPLTHPSVPSQEGMAGLQHVGNVQAGSKTQYQTVRGKTEITKFEMWRKIRTVADNCYDRIDLSLVLSGGVERREFERGPQTGPFAEMKLTIPLYSA